MSHEIPWVSKITKVEKNKLITYGIDQREIIREFSYEEMVFLLLFGRKPSTAEAHLFRAVIVSHCSHGITGQSTLALRMGADCRSPFLNSALGAFLVGSGEYHQGALQRSMEMIQEAGAAVDLATYVKDRLKSRKPFYGYGHRFHSKDPRAVVLMDLCDENNFVGKSIQTVRAIEKIIGQERGRFMNIEAAGGGILLDLGFPPEVASLVVLMGRSPMYAAAYLERLRSGAKPFQRIAVYDIVPGEK